MSSRKRYPAAEVRGSKKFGIFYNTIEDRYLKKIIDRFLDLLKEDVGIGEKIGKSLWPEKYVRRYGINNLYKYNLSAKWRATYTIIGDKRGRVAVVLEVMDHRAYDRLFRYKTT